MKIYKHYFNKDDSIFNDSYQVKNKYHTHWYDKCYNEIFYHKVIKIKLFGIFTIYKIKEIMK